MARWGLVLSSLLITGWFTGCGGSSPENSSPTVQTAPANTGEPADSFVNSIGMKLKRIPLGEFQMGSDRDDPFLKSSELPRHTVAVSRPIWMGVYEVTQKQYHRITKERPSWFSASGSGRDSVKGMDTADFPVEFVGWEDAVYFCQKLSQLPAERAARRVYRLPTEAEWEYCCRAGSTTRFHFGHDSNRLAEYAWIDEDPVKGRTHRVGEKLPNAFGLHDMMGNVYEWCHDWYEWDYYRRSPGQDPTGPRRGAMHVMRGGSINFGNSDDCRSAARSCDAPPSDGYPYSHVGFRVVCEIQPAGENRQ